MHISLVAEPVFYFLGLPITNSLIATWISMAFLAAIVFFVYKGLKASPSPLQNFIEFVLSTFLDLVESVAGPKGREFFPLVVTFFLFIILSNWLGLLPGFGSVGVHHKDKFVPLLRGATADLNTTLALALISVFSIQFFGIKHLKLAYLKRFFNLKTPIDFFVGILELISDFAKIISFSFRLFGNIFAGEVLLVVMAFLVPVIAPLPFYGLELFVGFIQALVFALLTLVFINVATSHGEEV